MVTRAWSRARAGIRAGIRAASIAGVLLLAAARPTAAHPLHTTLTELSVDRVRGTLHIVIRVFADDFGTASTAGRRGARTPVTDAANSLAYVQRAFVLTDGARILPLRSCGTRQGGALLWICVEADPPRSPAGLRLRNALLCDLFADQVNIVRSTLGGAPRSLLFTRGDQAKPLL